jgi:16S rRNA (guanine527-N7)-methyltransferase
VIINTYEEFCSYQHVSRETFNKFEIFIEVLLKWQKSVNLISNSTINTIWKRHFLDSAQLYTYSQDIKGNILDIGSGAGFPGMILAMMGNNNVNLIESDQKKCIFMREVARLTNTKVKIYNCRIEDLDYMKPELIISRALAPLSKLIEYVDNHMNKNIEENKATPKLLFLKGKNYNNEIYDLLKIKKLEIDIFPSITDDFGKVLYIKNINLC